MTHCGGSYDQKIGKGTLNTTCFKRRMSDKAVLGTQERSVREETLDKSMESPFSSPPPYTKSSASMMND